MAVALLVESDEGSVDSYERVRRSLGPDKPDGGIFHIAGPAPSGGWRVIEVWESEEQAERFFRERYLPALRAAGLRGPLPRRELWPVHTAMR